MNNLWRSSDLFRISLFFRRVCGNLNVCVCACVFVCHRALNKADKESKTVTRKSSPVKVAPVASQRPGHAQQQQLLPARKPTNIRKVVTLSLSHLSLNSESMGRCWNRRYVSIMCFVWTNYSFVIRRETKASGPGVTSASSALTRPVIQLESCQKCSTLLNRLQLHHSLSSSYLLSICCPPVVIASPWRPPSLARF